MVLDPKGPGWARRGGWDPSRGGRAHDDEALEFLGRRIGELASGEEERPASEGGPYGEGVACGSSGVGVAIEEGWASPSPTEEREEDRLIGDTIDGRPEGRLVH